MARARNIKPAFFKNEELADLDFATRLLFIGLWTLADRAGRLEDRPKRIKMEVFPADDVDVEAGLTDLDARGLILRYARGDARFIQVVNFAKHQSPHIKEPASVIPAPDQNQTSPVQTPDEHPLNPDSLNPDTGMRTPDSGGSAEGADAPAAEAAPPKPDRSVRAVPKPKIVAHRLPPDWQPPDEAVEWAKRAPPDGLGLPAAFVDSETERFRDYWLGSVGSKVDWLRVWRSWMRKEAQDRRPAARNGRGEGETGLLTDSEQYKGDRYLRVKGRV